MRGPSDARRIGEVRPGPAGEDPNPPADVVLDRGSVPAAPPPESWSRKGAAAGGGGCGAAMEALCGGWCIGGDCM